MSSIDQAKLSEWVAAAKNRSIRSLSRLITQVENSPDAARFVVGALFEATGRAHIVGVTGPPGAGKSSLVTEMAVEIRRRDKRVAILAIDPSSPFTGGALLGDRVRMQQLAGDKDVFIRSMASRGSLGGLARAAAAVVKLLDAAGFDMILLETVGAGQAEVAIADQAHSTLVIEAPGMGDDVQSIKAGILEVADILVVNKADKPGAARTAKSLETMLHLGPTGGTRHHGRIVDAPDVVAARSEDAWQIPVIKTSAVEQTGISTLIDGIEAHKAHLLTHDLWQAREVERLRKEVDQLLLERISGLLQQVLPVGEIEREVAAVVARERDPYAAVDRLIERFLGEIEDRRK